MKFVIFHFATYVQFQWLCLEENISLKKMKQTSCRQQAHVMYQGFFGVWMSLVIPMVKKFHSFFLQKINLNWCNLRKCWKNNYICQVIAVIHFLFLFFKTTYSLMWVSMHLIFVLFFMQYLILALINLVVHKKYRKWKTERLSLFFLMVVISSILFTKYLFCES